MPQHVGRPSAEQDGQDEKIGPQNTLNWLFRCVCNATAGPRAPPPHKHTRATHSAEMESRGFYTSTDTPATTEHRPAALLVEAVGYTSTVEPSCAHVHGHVEGLRLKRWLGGCALRRRSGWWCGWWFVNPRAARALCVDHELLFANCDRVKACTTYSPVRTTFQERTPSFEARLHALVVFELNS